MVVGSHLEIRRAFLPFAAVLLSIHRFMLAKLRYGGLSTQFLVDSSAVQIFGKMSEAKNPPKPVRAANPPLEIRAITRV